MNRTGLAFVALLSCGAALLVEPTEAQTVRGTVVTTGEEAAPLEGGIVRLMTADSQHVDMVLTSRSGIFVLRAPRAGRYMLRVEHVLYAQAESAPFQVAAGGTVRRELVVAPRDDGSTAARWSTFDQRTHLREFRSTRRGRVEAGEAIMGRDLRWSYLVGSASANAREP
jgi:hypothetical protein